MQSLPGVLEYLAKVVVQDALELSSKYPKNPVFAFLTLNPEFQALRAAFISPGAQAVSASIIKTNIF